MALMTFAWTIVIGFTFLAFISAPHQTETTPAVAGLNRQQADAGQAAFVETCSGCHGEFGEGGPNPSKPGSIIPPISSKGFLAAFTDDTLFNIVSNGLSDRGMAAFSTRNGGPLDDSKIELIVSYLRHWETNPPVVADYVPPAPSQPGNEAFFTPSADEGDLTNGAVLFHSWCSNCHGADGTNSVRTKAHCHR